MFEEEQAKVITEQEQERMNLEATLELQRKLDAREEVPAEATQAIQEHEIDWNDPSVWDQTQSFMPMDSEKESKEKAKERMKRKTSKAREDKIKREKTKDDPEKLTLMEYVQVVSNSEEAINVIPLAVKSLIVSWKSYCKGDMGFYEIHKADRNYKTYKFFSEMLNDFDRDDLIMIYRLFNEKYASTRPGFDDLMLWGDMKIMFDPDENVEKKYPLPQDTLTRMLRWKLHVNYEIPEMAYELLKFIRLATTLNRLERSIKFRIYILRPLLYDGVVSMLRGVRIRMALIVVELRLDVVVLVIVMTIQLILFIVDSGCTKHMTGNLKLLCNFVEKYMGTVHFGNDQFALILGYGDLVQGNITINRVYYVEGLNHNLFSVGQFCDADLEVAFWKSTCFVRDL
ncbi:hypothetical protein Tco_0017369 [Tanacetum coccineum]